jgi:hypothetical protein
LAAACYSGGRHGGGRRRRGGFVVTPCWPCAVKGGWLRSLLFSSSLLLLLSPIRVAPRSPFTFTCCRWNTVPVVLVVWFQLVYRYYAGGGLLCPSWPSAIMFWCLAGR